MTDDLWALYQIAQGAELSTLDTLAERAGLLWRCDAHEPGQPAQWMNDAGQPCEVCGKPAPILPVLTRFPVGPVVRQDTPDGPEYVTQDTPIDPRRWPAMSVPRLAFEAGRVAAEARLGTGPSAGNFNTIYMIAELVRRLDAAKGE